MPELPDQVWVGLDLGTSGLKAVALGPRGDVVASARTDYSTARPEVGASEQSTDDWWAAVSTAVSALAAAVDPSHWAAIGLSAMIPTLVLADDGGSAYGPAITWEDARSEDEGDALREAYGPEALARLTGQWVDGRYLLPMAMRLASTGGVSASATSLLGAKDWLLQRLTGIVATDPSTATGTGCFDLATGDYDPAVLAAADALAGRALPRPAPVVASTQTYPLREDVARELGLPVGLPVAVGAADSVCGVLGLGVDAPGDVVIIAGTSTVILGLSDDLALDDEHRFLVTPLALDGYGLEMDLLATGSGLAWLATLLGVADASAVQALAQTEDPADDDVPTFLPYVAPGEQGALWDPMLTGALDGLTVRTTPAHLARAFASGLVCETRRCLGVLDEKTPRRGVVHFSGQGVDAAALRELADASGREVHACGGAVPHSAAGAAAIAAIACGAGGSSTAYSVAHVVAGPSVSPRPERAALWADLAARHDAALARQRG